MTEKFFKACMAELSKQYTVTPNDVQYKNIWESTRRFADEYFKKICDKVILIYHPTNMNPFPGAHIFYDAHMDLESTKRTVPQYVPIRVPQEDLPDAEFIKNFMAEVHEILNKRTTPPVCEMERSA